MQIGQPATNGNHLQNAMVSSNGHATGRSANHAIMGSNGIASSTIETALSKSQSQKLSHQLANGGVSPRCVGPLLQTAPTSQPLERGQGSSERAQHRIGMQSSFGERIATAAGPSKSPAGQGEPTWFWRLDEEERHESVLSMMGV